MILILSYISLCVFLYYVKHSLMVEWLDCPGLQSIRPSVSGRGGLMLDHSTLVKKVEALNPPLDLSNKVWEENLSAHCYSRQKGKRSDKVWLPQEEGPVCAAWSISYSVGPLCFAHKPMPYKECTALISSPIQWVLCDLHTLMKIESVFAYQYEFAF